MCKMEEKMITKAMITAGLDAGIVRLITDPIQGSGAVCQIGEYWFYFGGLTAEEESPEEYLAHVPKEDIVEEIESALDGFRFGDPDAQGRYRYYYCVFAEQLKMSENYKKNQTKLQLEFETLRLKAAKYKAFAFNKQDLGKRLEQQIEKNQKNITSSFDGSWLDSSREKARFQTLEGMCEDRQISDKEYAFSRDI